MNMRVSDLFANHMVLQREIPVPVWGTGTPGELVTVTLQGQETSAQVGPDGNWSTTMQPLTASAAETMVIRGESGELILEDVAVGEVWIASGQSNMEFHMRYDKDYSSEKPVCANENIRFFDVPMISTEKGGRLFDYKKNFGFWRMADPEDLEWFSAVGYYFAKNLQPALDVPVGIIGVNCGGSRCACWMDEETIRECGPVWMEDYQNGLQSIPDLEKAEADYYNGGLGDHSQPFANPVSDRLMYGVSIEEIEAAFGSMAQLGGMVIGPWHEWRPAGLYHTMLEKVIPYAVRGVLWYQGESDEDHPEIYADMLDGMIKLWRRRWGYRLPFIITQLAPLGEAIGAGGRVYPILRKQQQYVADHTQDVFLTATGDVGHAYDIHPKEKQPVGRRMALLARGHVYGEKLLCDAPVPDSVNRDNDRIVVHFENAEGGLVLKGEAVEAVEVFLDGNKIAASDNTLEAEKSSLLVKIPGRQIADHAVEIRFAETPYFTVNLFNQSDIPVIPFTAKV